MFVAVGMCFTAIMFALSITFFMLPAEQLKRLKLFDQNPDFVATVLGVLACIGLVLTFAVGVFR